MADTNNQATIRTFIAAEVKLDGEDLGPVYEYTYRSMESDKVARYFGMFRNMLKTMDMELDEHELREAMRYFLNALDYEMGLHDAGHYTFPFLTIQDCTIFGKE